MQDVLLGKTLDELTALVKDLGLPAFTGKQLADWLYKKHVGSIDEMTNLSKAARTLLNEQFQVGCRSYSMVQSSADGTRKFLFPTSNHQAVEAVMISEAERATLCVSSQVGCRMGCRFCMTARQGFRANLSVGEIINQFCSIDECEQLTNAVYMGMGEPLDNLDNVLKSLDILTAPWGFSWSPRRITVSTIGILPALRRFLDESKCHLAISLHTPFGKERQELLPMQKAHPLEEVMAQVRQYDWRGQRRISFEYILFDRLNDSPKHAVALAKLLDGLECRVNLIRFHVIPDSPLLPALESNVEKFKNSLISKGIMTTVRASRGKDILAACGLLSTKG
ncbi:MAG: 23S rRNA (adenine(2503)-C(2))-methyltransferase RlmN [Prevotellaceae bacterium]|jgi:23S rRNA (adenine2503-C2)-methyltransferase|nr:23S rRNA (adenine(2503)-C(2))-methyltransferase RlmN [Prevotellaceae bacterium]